ncbi:MAG: hypothetical protein U0M63_01115 [Alistipes onderdonkii]|jgi:hypothetical protein|uniref:hypothetical protein n=1 Tax=Alistipes onderdonkii TaxID=328813 RepID=UPI0020702957|nr:hypothetical protein [Alistipes onderdonkii]MEE0848253.1 hypothetical protein [Alistipes onderdonkii]DAE34965.1 MAG TPA: hypothetical protein [Caudoviricetes sp.]DAG10343.1 MAG TPA: hypothetical protein [Caudoviricetes sp.]
MKNKTGIELIAEERAKIFAAPGKLEGACKMVARAEMLVELSGRPSKNVKAVNLLAEAGALIAAEIDRINNLKQE